MLFIEMRSIKVVQCTSELWTKHYHLNTHLLTHRNTLEYTHIHREKLKMQRTRVLTCPPIGTLLVNLVKHEETPRQPSLMRAVEE